MVGDFPQLLYYLLKKPTENSIWQGKESRITFTINYYYLTKRPNLMLSGLPQSFPITPQPQAPQIRKIYPIQVQQ
jgi:hypothetical protein